MISFGIRCSGTHEKMTDVDVARPISPMGRIHSVEAQGDTESIATSDQAQRRTSIPKTLGTFDVASFNINKMIGTGIFTTPGTVLALTGDKRVALAMWIFGWAHTYIGCV